MKRFIGLTFVVFMLALTAVAQKPYVTPQFSVRFHSPDQVEAWSAPNVQKTSVDSFYASKTGGAFGIEQTVDFRQITGEIDVNRASLDFYAMTMTVHGETLKSKEYIDNFQGHIAVAVVVITKDMRTRRNLLIIHDSHTVFLLMQSSNIGTPDETVWGEFVNSFGMNENSCWLPEGCK